MNVRLDRLPSYLVLEGESSTGPPSAQLDGQGCPDGTLERPAQARLNYLGKPGCSLKSGPCESGPPPSGYAKVIVIPQLGGLLHRYERARPDEPDRRGIGRTQMGDARVHSTFEDLITKTTIAAFASGC